MDDRMKTIEAALSSARMFIHNGVELGFIRMPDPSTNDPASDCPRKIDEALATVRAMMAERPSAEGLEALKREIVVKLCGWEKCFCSRASGARKTIDYLAPMLCLTDIVGELSKAEIAIIKRYRRNSATPRNGSNPIIDSGPWCDTGVDGKPEAAIDDKPPSAVQSQSGEAREAFDWDSFFIEGPKMPSDFDKGWNAAVLHFKNLSPASPATPIDLQADLAKVREAVICGRTVRNTFGGNVGGGKDVFEEALAILDKLTARTGGA